MNSHMTTGMASATRRFIAGAAVSVFLVALCPFSKADVLADDESDSVGSDNSILGDEDVQRQPRVEGGRFVLPSLITPTIATADIGNGRLPEGFRGDDESAMQPLPESGQERTGSGQERSETWNWTVANWSAANTYSYPRYFEDRMLERHGHERFGHLQPLASGARFFATVPMLPYLMTLRDPFECESTLGYYRSGTCAPVMRQRPPLDRRAVIAEAAAVAGAIVVLP